ncbi:MAG: spore gernimation protein GerQ [Bacillales bacterium]|jgi:spore coat protein CotF|nr:spore gernimation protein GerQ [Bacillales bacterium]
MMIKGVLNMSGQQSNQTHQNMQTGSVPQQLNHGAREILAVTDALGASIDTMNQYLIFRQHVKGQELLGILDRQYKFMQDEYNITVECFQSGKDPSKPTGQYKMQMDNDFVYGLKPGQPKKPFQSINEISDEYVSARMLGALKAGTSAKVVAAIESTNPVVRRVLADSIPNCIEMAYEVSIFLNKNGFYHIPQFPEQDAQQLLSAYSVATEQPQMPPNKQ